MNDAPESRKYFMNVSSKRLENDSDINIIRCLICFVNIVSLYCRLVLVVIM